MPDNAHFLAKANARRHDAALAAAHEAIERLSREGRSVNFEAVANAAGVSRAWLYREPEIREPSPSCERCRRGRLRALLCGRAPTRYANASTPPETRSPVRAENDALRDQLARHLGAQRVQPLRQRPGGPR